MTYWLQGARVRPEARQIHQELRPANLSLVSNTRARLRIALFGTLAIAAFLAFVVFPPRKLLVEADGAEIVVVSRQQDVVSLLDAVGVERDPGDVFIQSAGEIEIDRAVPVIVQVDGQMLSWRSRASTIDELLTELSIDVSPHDAITYNGQPSRAGDSIYATAPILTATISGGVAPTQEPPNEHSVILDIKRAVPVTLVEDGRAVSLQSSASTLEGVLRQAGVQLGPADEIYPAPSTAVTAGMEVEVRHAKVVNLRIGASSTVIYTHQETLEAALAEAGLTFGEEDRVEPALGVAVTDGMEARVIDVTGRSYYEYEPVEHITVFEPDESLSGTDTRRVQGSDGVKVFEYRISIEDGVEVEKALVDEYYEPEPVNTVIYYAASALNSTSIDPQNLRVQSVRRMYGTWYNAASSGKEATHSAYGITKSGMPLTKGIVAVDPSVIPLGTRLYVPGYGFAIAGDTGGGIIGNMIDLGYPDGVAVDWITGWTDVYILAP